MRLLPGMSEWCQEGNEGNDIRWIGTDAHLVHVVNSCCARFSSRGGVLGGLEVHRFEGMGRGLLATRALAAGELAVKVPLGLCMSRATAIEAAQMAGDPKLLAVFMDKQLSDEDAIA